MSGRIVIHSLAMMLIRNWRWIVCVVSQAESSRSAADAAAAAAAARAEVELEELRGELAASEDIRLQLARQLASAEEAVTGRMQLLNAQVGAVLACCGLHTFRLQVVPAHNGVLW
jgi:hypothetical protein